jgi:hypothetical protein
MSAKLQRIIIFILFVQIPNFAFAGAWLPKAGHNQFINTILQTPEETNYIETYAESGISNNTSIVYRQFFGLEKNEIKIGEALLGVHKNYWKSDNYIASAQFGVIFGREFSQNSTAKGFEIRNQFGMGFNKSWLNFETGLRNCNKKYSFPWEITTGYNYTAKRTILLKSFGENNGCNSAIIRNQISTIYNLDTRRKFEFGYRFGKKESQIAPKGVFASFWLDF